MHVRSRAVFTALLLLGCDKPRTTTASSSASATPPLPPTASATPSASAVVAPPAPSASVAASASAAPASPCAEGARKDDDARYCITLPKKKPLAISYEGDKPSKGIREELEVSGDRLVITVDPAPKGKTVAQLKAEAIKRPDSSLVESGDLTGGYWIDGKTKDGQHVVEGMVVGKYAITCTHWVRDEKNLEAARGVCRSLTTF